MLHRKSMTLIVIVALLLSGVSFGFMFKKKKIDPVYLTAEQLAQYDGKNGQPMYVAVDGKIYDLTKCRYWKDGVHDKSPQAAIAGRDLTEVLKTSKHGIKRVTRYPHVGFLVDSVDDIPQKESQTDE